MTTYTVKAGDSWARIAGEVFGDQRRLFELADANGGIGRMLHAGQEITIPGLDLSKPAVITHEQWAGVASGGRRLPDVPNFGAGPAVVTAPAATTTSNWAPWVAASQPSVRRTSTLPPTPHLDAAWANAYRPPATYAGAMSQRSSLGRLSAWPATAPVAGSLYAPFALAPWADIGPWTLAGRILGGVGRGIIGVGRTGVGAYNWITGSQP